MTFYLFKKSYLVLALALVLSSLSCKKDNNDDPDENSSNSYFKGSLNNAPFDWKASENGEWTSGTSASSSVLYGEGQGSLTGWVGKVQNTPPWDLKPSLGVRFQTFDITESSVSTQNFNKFINLGAWSYSDSEYGELDVKNLIVEYTDPQGNQFNSVGLQSGSSFNVVSVTPEASSIGKEESLKVKVAFNCKLYPVEGGGPALTLSNAEALLSIENLF